jgi:hypothetical protein
MERRSVSKRARRGDGGGRPWWSGSGMTWEGFARGGRTRNACAPQNAGTGTCACMNDSSAKVDGLVACVWVRMCDCSTSCTFRAPSFLFLFHVNAISHTEHLYTATHCYCNIGHTTTGRRQADPHAQLSACDKIECGREDTKHRRSKESDTHLGGEHPPP